MRKKNLLEKIAELTDEIECNEEIYAHQRSMIKSNTQEIERLKLDLASMRDERSGLLDRLNKIMSKIESIGGLDNEYNPLVGWILIELEDIK
jgi:chromosome segregation ATPase